MPVRRRRGKEDGKGDKQKVVAHDSSASSPNQDLKPLTEATMSVRLGAGSLGLLRPKRRLMVAGLWLLGGRFEQKGNYLKDSFLTKRSARRDCSLDR